MTVCVRCGLPQELCVCESIAKETQKVTIAIEQKKFGKKYTIITGISDIDLDQLAKKLKAKLACGGTVKEGRIELQGGGGDTPTAERDHKNKVRELLINMGFAPEAIVIK
ncbi:MAG: stress response translation initiation inhibitor YciH [Candidatus Woesearchaeota archaeon]